jgi:outer membrane protein OmpA-like peptidoglycan-associated protein
VVIEGHTDAVGTENTTRRLSQRRAQSGTPIPGRHTRHQATRLQAVGLGEHDPLPGRNPLAGENRRVQFRGQ